MVFWGTTGGLVLLRLSPVMASDRECCVTMLLVELHSPLGWFRMLLCLGAHWLGCGDGSREMRG